MNKVFKIKCLFIFLFSSLILNSALAQLIANAGTGKVVCPGVTFSLGGSPSASGGNPPYTYSWAPGIYLLSTTTANPECSPKSDVYYTLTVTDASGATSIANVQVGMAYINYIDAGETAERCLGDSTLIGVVSNIYLENLTYSWLPTNGLSDSFSPRPMAAPTQTTTYQLTATITGCEPKVDAVTITVIPPPSINAGIDTTIIEGKIAILHGSGGFFYQWSPDNNLKYPSTANPDAEPIVTTEYILLGRDKTGKCVGRDTVVVTVKPFDEIVLYNTFTPNQDGSNDNWYIGNIEKYPKNKLEILNRYGKLVYKTSGYENDPNGNSWDGKAYGENLPAATYFYFLDLGVAGKKYHGTVTIVE